VGSETGDRVGDDDGASVSCAVGSETGDSARVGSFTGASDVGGDGVGGTGVGGSCETMKLYSSASSQDSPSG
jgi:hypothetical protein